MLPATRHGFGLSQFFLVTWPVFLVWRIALAFRERRRIERRETLAAKWPAVAGKIRAGWVKQAHTRWRLTLNYDAFESGHGIELWQHDLLSKGEAEHAVRMLTGKACRVYYNPENEGETTLLWSEVQRMLAAEPYVPVLAPLGRDGYRWLIGWTGLAAAGLVASVTVFVMAMAGTSTCVCDAMMGLLAVSPVIAIGSVAPMSRMMVVAPRTGMLSRLRWVLGGWQLAVLAILLAGVTVSFIHYGPILRALPMNADVPDRVLAGALGVLQIPVYLFATMTAGQGLRRLKPVSQVVGIPTAA